MKGQSGNLATFTMEFFMTIDRYWKTLFLITNSSNLDVAVFKTPPCFPFNVTKSFFYH